MNCILTNDPSLTAWGWAVIESDGHILDWGTIKTESSPKKLKIRKGDDYARRIKEILEEMKDILSRWNIVLILSEQPHGSQSFVSAMMVGICNTIVQATGSFNNIPVELFSEQDSKKAIAGTGKLSKREMIDIVQKKYGHDWIPEGVKWRDEAVADALAIYYVATKQSDLLKMITIPRKEPKKMKRTKKKKL
jgi:Holliday junction resolvasome RuvABC endonuclease subunit